MNRSTYENVRHLSKQALAIEQMHKSLSLQMGAFVRMGLPEEALIEARDAYIALKKKSGSLKRAAFRAMKGEPIYEFAKETTGLGPAVAMVLGNAPEFVCRGYDEKGNAIGFDSPGALWSYAGLIPGKGRKKGERAMYNPKLKAYAIARLAEPCMKLKGGEDKNGKPLPRSPYREVYDARKEHTLETHPPMVEEDGVCEFCDMARGKSKELRAEKNQERERTTVAMDCANVGGVHWTDGHRHADAMRVTAKAILLDLWRVENGLTPRWAIQALTPISCMPAGVSHTTEEHRATLGMTPSHCLPDPPSVTITAAVGTNA